MAVVCFFMSVLQQNHCLMLQKTDIGHCLLLSLRKVRRKVRYQSSHVHIVFNKVQPSFHFQLRQVVKSSKYANLGEPELQNKTSMFSPFTASSTASREQHKQMSHSPFPAAGHSASMLWQSWKALCKPVALPAFRPLSFYHSFNCWVCTAAYWSSN